MNLLLGIGSGHTISNHALIYTQSPPYYLILSLMKTRIVFFLMLIIGRFHALSINSTISKMFNFVLSHINVSGISCLNDHCKNHREPL